MRTRFRVALASLCVLMGALGAQAATASAAYNPIVPTKANETVVMDGKHLTVQQLVDVARHGAKVELSADARQRSMNAYLLLLQGARENMPIYFFNRGTGSGRQQPIFSGDPLSTSVDPSLTCPTSNVACSNRDFLLERQLRTFRNGPRQGFGPEVADEEIVRAMMAVRVNTMVYEAATPQLTQMLIDLLNKRVTPVVQSRGTPGEGDLPQMGNVEGTMVGVGDAYHNGVRMSAGQALAQAGLQRLQDQPAQPSAPGAPFAADDAALVSTNAYTSGQAALLLHDTRHMLNWSDILYSTALEGMNSSITPIASIVQQARPFPWQNFVADRVLDMITPSYLFELDQLSDTGVPVRIIQDPESLRATSQRNGAAWQAWSRLKKNVTIQNNSSDHNPAVLPGTSPKTSPELDTPWFEQYFVEGGPNNAACKGQGCQQGYILSNANWDPISMDNDIEALTNAVANMVTANNQVIQRFTNVFFTVIGPGTAPTGVLTATQNRLAAPRAAEYTIADLMAEIQTLQNPVPAQGNAIVQNVEDLEAEGRIKVARARLAVDNTLQMLGQELLTTSYWINLRHIQGEQLGLSRSFGPTPTAVWQAFRQVVPWQMEPLERPEVPPGALAYAFLQANSPAAFFPPAADEPKARHKKQVKQAIRAAKARTSRYLSRASVKRKFLTTQARERPGR
jgi:histidine ammonia-lyase